VPKGVTSFVDDLARLVDDVGDLWPRAKRGRRPIHSPRKMAVICILTVVLGLSCRSMETLLCMLKRAYEKAPYKVYYPYP